MNLKTLLSKLIGNNNTLSNNVLFIDYVGGNHSKAQLLSQMFYWSSRTKRKDGFFAKTYEEWYEEIRLPKHSIYRYCKEFVRDGFLETKVVKFNGYPTVHYKLDNDKLIQSLVTFCNDGLEHCATMDSDNLQRTLDSDNLQRTSNRDYQRLQTENTNRESAREKKQTEPEIIQPLKAEPSPSKKVARNKVSTDYHALAKKARDMEERHLKGLRDEDLEIINNQTPENWIEAVEMCCEYFKTGLGIQELKMQCRSAGVEFEKVDIRQVLTQFFGKKKSQPLVWMNPMNYTASLTAWIKTEYSAKARYRSSTNNQKPNALKIINNDKYARYEAEWRAEQEQRKASA